MSIFRTIIKLLFYSFIIWLFVKAFLFQTYHIPSSSMYGSFFEGDFVVINKMAYGPRSPITPLSFNFNGTKKYVDWIHLPYYRLFGYSKIQRGDVIAFNYDPEEAEPIDLQEEFIKRCVALPGDTIQLKAGDVYTNSELIKTETAYHVYRVMTDQPLDIAGLKRSGIMLDKFDEGNNSYSLLMNAASADSLSKLKHIRSVTKELFPKEYYNPVLYPHFPEYPWNYDHFGPLWIPGKGDSILLNKKNMILYQHCIEKYEKDSVSSKGDTIFISGKKKHYYHFKQNYYFVLGDNRHNSNDSRVTGLIPEDHIIGKASMILYSSTNISRKFLKVK